MKLPPHCLGAGCGRALVSAGVRRARRPAGTHPHAGRGLCHRCWHQCQRDGVLEDYPRINRPTDEVLNDWTPLRLRGFTIGQAAEQLGMSYGALERVLVLARKAGDPRAPYLVRP